MNSMAFCGDGTEVIVKSYLTLILPFITWPLNITASVLVFSVFETLLSLIHLHVLTLCALICLTNY